MQPVCHLHLASAATDTCQVCLKPVCELCTLVDGGLAKVCPSCIRERRKRDSVKRVSLIAGGLALAAAAFVYLRSVEWPYDYGEHRSEIRRLEAQLEKEPCDRGYIVELGDLMLKAGNARGAMARSKKFFEACGEHERLLWVTYGAHKRLSEWDAAAAVATELIESDRYDHDYWWWRGMAYEQKGDWERAVADYRQSISLLPRAQFIPFNLAEGYEKLGRPCEAIFPLEQFLHYHPEVPNAAAVRARIDALTEKGSCDAQAGEGRAVVPFNPASPVITATVSLGAEGRGTFIIDTGATYVTLSREFAERAGIRPASNDTILVQTAGGVRSAKLTTLDRVELQGVRATRVPAAIMGDLPNDVDGLLGLSFLSRFQIQIDRGAGRLEIASRGRKKN
jgi:clan AA aspartic protease (TIGR02281 family)